MAISSGFLAVAWAAGARKSPYGKAMFAGLACSWWGDLFLVPGGWRYFLAGLIAFLLGHAAYCCAYIIHRTRLSYAGIAAVPMGVSGLLLARWLWPHVPEYLRVFVAAYIVVISLMVTLAIGTLPRPAGWLIVLGAAAFFCSDIGVASAHFLRGNHGPIVGQLKASVAPLYFGGQFMLAGSIALVNRARAQ